MQYPITITLEITCDNDLLNLWHRLNCAEFTVRDLAAETGYLFEPANCNASWPWWEQVDKLVKQAEIEDQL
jgi:hypothetical protein